MGFLIVDFGTRSGARSRTFFRGISRFWVFGTAEEPSGVRFEITGMTGMALGRNVEVGALAGLLAGADLRLDGSDEDEGAIILVGRGLADTDGGIDDGMREGATVVVERGTAPGCRIALVLA